MIARAISKCAAENTPASSITPVPHARLFMQKTGVRSGGKYADVRRDVENLKAAVTGTNVTEAFLTVVAPASAVYDGVNEFWLRLRQPPSKLQFRAPAE
jgi:hypothetical protein